MEKNKTATYPSLNGKIVFITGGGGGIGASIVNAFCEQNSKVFFVDIDIFDDHTGLVIKCKKT